MHLNTRTTGLVPGASCRRSAHCLEMLQRGYRAKYTQNERDFGLLTLRIGGPWLLHASNHARCAPSRDEVLPMPKHQPIVCGKTIAVEDMLAVLPSKLPFCAYSICVEEVGIDGDIVPSLVGNPSPVLYGFCMEHAGVLEIQSESEWLALRRQLEAGTIRRASVCAVWLIVPMHRKVSNRDTSWIAFSAINRFCASNQGNGQQGGQNRKWPTSGQGGFITTAAWGIPGASERGAESEVAHLWARCQHNACRLGIPTALDAGQNQKWPTSGQGGYITAAAWGIAAASERGAKSEVAHKWAR